MFCFFSGVQVFTDLIIICAPGGYQDLRYGLLPYLPRGSHELCRKTYEEPIGKKLSLSLCIYIYIYIFLSVPTDSSFFLQYFFRPPYRAGPEKISTEVPTQKSEAARRLMNTFKVDGLTRALTRKCICSLFVSGFHTFSWFF